MDHAVMWGAGVAVLVLLWFLWISRGTSDADPNTLSYRFHRAWRRLAFWLGDVKFYWQTYFGFLPLPTCSWTHHDYAVSIEDLLRVCKRLKQGDVLLATKHGYWFSNTAIPGCFKHAGIIVHGPAKGQCHSNSIMSVYDPSTVKLVEAVSEGVVERHPLYARADRMIFLRPKHMEDYECERASKMAHKMVGCKYDANFDFNIPQEIEAIEKDPPPVAQLREEIAELRRIEDNHKGEFDIAFSCTETVAAAWWFRRRQLGISRKKSRGRLVITADQFVNRDFKVIWTNMQPHDAELHGLHEEGVRELKAYWEDRASGRHRAAPRDGEAGGADGT